MKLSVTWIPESGPAVRPPEAATCVKGLQPFETAGAKIEMIKRSAGILLFRRIHGSAQVLLIHPGGPYWRRKDEGAWSIPKGLFDKGEEPLSAAKREFLEETGTTPQGAFIELGEFRQPSGKHQTVWAPSREIFI